MLQVIRKFFVRTVLNSRKSPDLILYRKEIILMVLNKFRQWGTVLSIVIMVSGVSFAQTPDTIATVNGNPISTLAFQQRVRFTRWTIGQQLSQIVQQMGVTALT